MTDRLRRSRSSPNSSGSYRRAHSHREQIPRESSVLHLQNLERIQRHFDDELFRTERDLQWARQLDNTPFAPARIYVDNLRSKLKNDYNQLVQEKVQEIERNMYNRYNEERRSSRRKLRKAHIESEKLRLQTINQIVQDQNLVCDEKLAVQRGIYDRLLYEQQGRLRAQQSLQSYESLNIGQLKDRLSRLESSNSELKQLIYELLNQHPMYRSTVYIPDFVP